MRFVIQLHHSIILGCELIRRLKQTNTQKRAALYCRLSREDEQSDKDSNSESITNQILMLTTYAQQHNFKRFETYVDDGYSGTSLDRPDLQRLIKDIKGGLIDTVIVKDRSRIGRNYVEVGKLTDEFFIEHNVRFISVLDGADTAKGIDEFSPFRDIINEWYAKDISKKTRASLYARGREGKKMSSRPIYGYKADSNGDWIIDEYAAEIVRRIFTMYLAGKGVTFIAKSLSVDNIPTPMKHKYGRITKHSDWNGETVKRILNYREYVGDTVNFKTIKVSYKSRKIVERPKEENMIFLNTHEAIISRETFEDVQKELAKRKGHSVPIRFETGMFSGLLICSDCGAHLTKHKYKTKTGSVINYVCSVYRQHYNSCTSHYIREDELLRIVSDSLERIVEAYDNRLEQILIKRALTEKDQAYIETNELLNTKKDRIETIDTILKELYEEKIKGSIPNDMFLNLYSQFKVEQDELNRNVYELTKQLGEQKDVCLKINRFLKVIKGYTINREAIYNLSREDMLELIDCIVVSEKQKSEQCQRKIEIKYRHVGNIDNLLPVAK